MHLRSPLLNFCVVWYFIIDIVYHLGLHDPVYRIKAISGQQAHYSYVHTYANISSNIPHICAIHSLTEDAIAVSLTDVNYYTKLTKLNSVALVRERTIPTERPPPVGEVSANFCG